MNNNYMNNNYRIEHIVDSLHNKGYTNFITRQELMYVKGRLSKKEYQIYELYPESSKIILYQQNIPSIALYKINNSTNLRHQDILGTIYSLGVQDDTFGDIIKFNNEFYIFLIPSIVSYFKYNLVKIKNNKVNLEQVPFSLSEQFKQEYIIKEYIVSSLRIDNVVSTIVNTGRREVLEKFKNKEVALNYNDEVKPTRILQVGDFFSIRKFGKYKYNRILKETKKGHFLIEIFYYI